MHTASTLLTLRGRYSARRIIRAICLPNGCVGKALCKILNLCKVILGTKTFSCFVKSSFKDSCSKFQKEITIQVCPPATREDIERFQAAMTICFGRAVDAGLSIAVSPRLDDGLGIGGWRNGGLLIAVTHRPGCQLLQTLRCGGRIVRRVWSADPAGLSCSHS